MRGSGLIGSARDIATWITGAPPDACTDADVWPELARRLRRPVLILDRDTGYGRCVTADGAERTVRRIRDHLRFDDGTRLGRRPVVVLRRGMCRFEPLRHRIARILRRSADELERQIGVKGPDLEARAADAEPADGDDARTRGVVSPPVAAAQGDEELVQPPADGTAARRGGTPFHVPLERQGLAATAEPRDNAQTPPSPVPRVPGPARKLSVMLP